MKIKEYYKLILGLTDDQVEQLYEMSAKMGITITDMIEKTIDLLEDGTIGEELIKKMHADLEFSFLSYLMSLSKGDFREFIDCLIFLKQKQNTADEVDVLLKQIEDHEVDEPALTKLTRICGHYGVDADKENMDNVKACLEEEKGYIRSEMYVADLGFEPDNLYSAVDVVKGRYDKYCQLYMKENADMTEELKRVFSWIEENDKYFHPID